MRRAGAQIGTVLSRRPSQSAGNRRASNRSRANKRRTRFDSRAGGGLRSAYVCVPPEELVLGERSRGGSELAPCFYSPTPYLSFLEGTQRDMSPSTRPRPVRVPRESKLRERLFIKNKQNVDFCLVLSSVVSELQPLRAAIFQRRQDAPLREGEEGNTKLFKLLLLMALLLQASCSSGAWQLKQAAETSS